jgi:hypothetical protein
MENRIIIKSLRKKLNQIRKQVENGVAINKNLNANQQFITFKTCVQQNI